LVHIWKATIEALESYACKQRLTLRRMTIPELSSIRQSEAACPGGPAGSSANSYSRAADNVVIVLPRANSPANSWVLPLGPSCWQLIERRQSVIPWLSARQKSHCKLPAFQNLNWSTVCWRENNRP